MMVGLVHYMHAPWLSGVCGLAVDLKDFVDGASPAEIGNRLSLAVADRDALAAEVRVWRAYDDGQAAKFPTRTEVEAAMRATDVSGALLRAGGVA